MIRKKGKGQSRAIFDILEDLFSHYTHYHVPKRDVGDDDSEDPFYANLFMSYSN